MLAIKKSHVGSLGFSLDDAVAAFRASLDAFASSEGAPRPAADPLVEAVVAAGGYSVVDDAPAPAAPATPTRPQGLLSAIEFQARFTAQEWAGFLQAALGGDATALNWLILGAAADAIDLTHQRVKDGLAYLVSIGRLTQARADQILTP